MGAAQLSDGRLTRIERCKIQKQIEEKEKKLAEKTSRQTVHDRIIVQTKNFDNVIFYLSENGKESMEAIRRMSAYHFYRYKEQVGEKIKNMNSEISKMKNGRS